MGEQALGPRAEGIERSLSVKRWEGEGRERCPAPVQRRENPRGRNTQESNLAPTRAKHSGSDEGHGWFGGRKPLRRRCEAVWSRREARERREDRETGLRSSGWSKALKGEARERWRLKNASKDWGTYGPLKG